jgi:hypothetical protein
MNRKNIREIMIGVATWLVLASAVAFAGVTDGNPHPPSNYFGFQPPARGASYADPVFGTSIKRLTDAVHSPDSLSGGNLTWALVEYATMSPFNNNNTWLLLQNDSYYALYDVNGNYVKDVPPDMNASTEPRWSRTDNNVVYYKRGNQLKSYNAANGAIGVVHTFSEYGEISGNGESDISWDGDHMVIVGDGHDVFVYTFSSDHKGPAFNTGGNSFDSVYISADNKVTITWNQVGSGRFNGIELFDQNMNFLRQLTKSGGHMDMSRDVDGTPVLVWTNANDPTPICNNGIVKIRLSDGAQTCLAGLQLDWSLAVHITGSDQGWVAVSTYAPSDPNPSGGWPAYTDEVFRIKLDGSVVERLAHHRSRPFNSYNYQAWAAFSRDGSRLIYNSNYALQSLLGYPTEYSDVYMMTLAGGGGVGTVSSAPPFGSFDTPTNGATNVSGAVAVTGWALDDGSVSKVQIYREPVPGDPAPSANGKIFVGDATFVAGARPDVQNAYPTYPNANRAGWGYMLLTNMLPGGGNGHFTLHAYATDNEGKTTVLGSHGFDAANLSATKPFGTIDTPAQGQTVSGTITNFGWVLSSPGVMPANGSTITVFVDGAARGHVQYNLYRVDIASLFPGYANTNGAVGAFTLDTRTLSNGLHTIAWSATDNMGHTDGIGSRYFWVQN